MDNKALVIGIVLLASTFGYALGRIASERALQETLPTTLYPMTSDKVPTVQIDGIRNGNIVGTMIGDVRFFLANTQVLPSDAGEFSVQSRILLTDLITIDIPKGMHFVASKRGKKYYPVSSSRGESLSPKNRIYFRTAQEAEKAGYTK